MPLMFSEPENGLIHELLVAVDENGSLLSLVRKTNGDQQIISQEDLFRKETPLARASGRDAIFVRCKNGDRVQGSTIIIKYLYDGIWGTYRELEGELRKNASGKWQLQTKAQVPVHLLTLRSRTLFGRLSGIDRIDIN